jgi:hypothetical protein
VNTRQEQVCTTVNPTSALQINIFNCELFDLWSLTVHILQTDGAVTDSLHSGARPILPYFPKPNLAKPTVVDNFLAMIKAVPVD